MTLTPFGDYKEEGHRWITIFDTPFYPDTLDAAIERFAPVIERFAALVVAADSSAELLRLIQTEPKDMRGQLHRVFRKYVSPDTSVEMLKRVRKTEELIEQFGDRFRSLPEVQANLMTRPTPDEALIALLNEYADRGQKGYELTETFFMWFEAEFAHTGWSISGPQRAGQDIDLQAVLDDYPVKTPVDFVIRDEAELVRLIGFARYDSDRGGAQEDDRVGGNARRLAEIRRYADDHGIELKVVFLNEGPGLLLGSMWSDYADIEARSGGAAMVTTMKMAQAGRFSLDWIATGSE